MAITQTCMGSFSRRKGMQLILHHLTYLIRGNINKSAFKNILWLIKVKEETEPSHVFNVGSAGLGSQKESFFPFQFWPFLFGRGWFFPQPVFLMELEINMDFVYLLIWCRHHQCCQHSSGNRVCILLVLSQQMEKCRKGLVLIPSQFRLPFHSHKWPSLSSQWSWVQKPTTTFKCLSVTFLGCFWYSWVCPYPFHSLCHSEIEPFPILQRVSFRLSRFSSLLLLCESTCFEVFRCSLL